MKMEITLSEEDFMRLSPQAQAEVLNLHKGESGMKINGRETNQAASEAYDLTPALARNFLNGVSDDTRNFIKVFAENGGRVRPGQALAATGRSDPSKLAGIQSGITRRLRSITGDKSAFLLDWEFDGEDAGSYDGEWIVSETTHESLRKYFGIN